METQAITLNRNAPGFEAMVQRVYHGCAVTAGRQDTLEGTLHTHFAGMASQSHTWKREAFRDMLLYFYAKKCYAIIRNPGYIEVLANVSTFANKMVMPMDSWKKDALTPEAQLASFIRHCFARYDVPAFMENVFGSGNKVHMFWYVQLGRGESVQQLSAFPVSFTRKMAHEFRLAPKDYTVTQAIRRAQALGYGATTARAEAIVWAAFPENFEQEAFWSTVVQFVAREEQDIGFDVLHQVLVYIAAMRDVNADFCMQGRAWTALARQAAEWHAEEAKRLHAAGYCEWEPSAIRNFEIRKGEVIYRIVQLTSSEALYEEGSTMSHCVAEYADDCADGTIAIFSARKFIDGEAGYETLATIEVQLPFYTVAQARSRYNEMVGTAAHDVITAWATTEKIAINAHCLYEDMPAAPADVRPQPQLQPRQWQADRIPAGQPYRPYDAYDTISGGDIVKYIFIIIKILFLVAKCSQ